MRKRKRNGISFTLPVLTFLILAVLLQAAPGEKRKPASAAYGLVGGTIFQESGYALSNADVVLVPDPQPDRAPLKLKKLEAISDTRGEFAFRVPATPMQYTR